MFWVFYNELLQMIKERKKREDEKRKEKIILQSGLRGLGLGWGKGSRQRGWELWAI